MRVCDECGWVTHRDVKAKVSFVIANCRHFEAKSSPEYVRLPSKLRDAGLTTASAAPVEPTAAAAAAAESEAEAEAVTAVVGVAVVAVGLEFAPVPAPVENVWQSSVMGGCNHFFAQAMEGVRRCGVLVRAMRERVRNRTFRTYKSGLIGALPYSCVVAIRMSCFADE